MVVFDPEAGGPVIFQQKVLPFGSIASVTSFLRLSLAIWTLGTELLHLAWSSYFDDFLSLSEDGLEKHTDMVISFLFSTLGWKLSTEKLVDFDTICKVLGVSLDLTEAKLGTVVLQNTAERTDELVAELQQVLEEKTLSRKDAERLRGRLQFASCQVFGRVLRNHMKQLSEHVASGRKALTPIVLEALTSIREILVKNTPRRVTGHLSDHVHVYVDASFEPGGFSGIGGLVFSSDGKCLSFFSEPISTSLLEQIMSFDQETAIQELEALAVLAVVITFRPSLTNRKAVVFTDSESVRGSFLKSWSQNLKCSKILLAILEEEERLQAQLWVERVPSQSNPADHLSRLEVTEFSTLKRTRCDAQELWSGLVLPRGVGATNRSTETSNPIGKRELLRCVNAEAVFHACDLCVRNHFSNICSRIQGK